MRHYAFCQSYFSSKKYTNRICQKITKIAVWIGILFANNTKKKVKTVAITVSGYGESSIKPHLNINTHIINQKQKIYNLFILIIKYYFYLIIPKINLNYI